MKKTIFAFMILLAAQIVQGEEIKLAWDYQSGIDGYRCFQKTAYATDKYDYFNPVKPKNYPDGNIPQQVTDITVDLPGEPLKVLKYLFVCRAFKGSVESADSNEVGYKVVNTVPPTPINLSGSYDDDNQMINLTWEQPQDNHIIYKWIVYYRLSENTDFTDLGIVNYNHELTLSTPFYVVPKGDKKTVIFTVVAFRRSGVYSDNSGELSIEIDRGIVGPVQNLKIDIDIPVE
jgi:hypothetical protein